MRVRIDISYDGSFFEGFQYQTHTNNTVMNYIIKSLKDINIINKPVGSGRTDAKVHALRQTLHLDLPPFWSDLNRLFTTLNSLLNPKIIVLKIKEVNSDFHASFSAFKREYRYIIYSGKANPFYSNYFLQIEDFNYEKAKEAAGLFIGKHNFKFFKKEGTYTATNIRNIYKIKVYKKGDFTIFNFQSSGFLRAQVRLMVGMIIEHSKGKISLEQIKEQLWCKKLHFNRPILANGLYLVRSHYPLYSQMPLTKVASILPKNSSSS